jgi:hypothetical protein
VDTTAYEISGRADAAEADAGDIQDDEPPF